MKSRTKEKLLILLTVCFFAIPSYAKKDITVDLTDICLKRTNDVVKELGIANEQAKELSKLNKNYCECWTYANLRNLSDANFRRLVEIESNPETGDMEALYKSVPEDKLQQLKKDNIECSIMYSPSILILNEMLLHCEESKEEKYCTCKHSELWDLLGSEKYKMYILTGSSKSLTVEEIKEMLVIESKCSKER